MITVCLDVPGPGPGRALINVTSYTCAFQIKICVQNYIPLMWTNCSLFTLVCLHLLIRINHKVCLRLIEMSLALQVFGPIINKFNSRK